MRRSRASVARLSAALAPLALLVFPALTGCASTAGHSGSLHAALPDAKPYHPGADARVEVAAARAEAAVNDTRLLLVMGANWCHDSRALAGWLETPRFRQLVDENFALVFVDVGHPQSGEGRNLDIAAQFGLEDITGTPSLLVVTPEGTLVNPDTARSWRNAASRSEEAIYAELLELANRPV